MKYIFIVNPVAGKGKSLQLAKNIEIVCSDKKLDYIIHYTKAPKDATDIVASYKSETGIIYSVGGDGTLSEIVNGIVGSNNKLGVIPAGSGNDFYRTIKDFDEDKTIDIGKVNDTYFINFLSFGMDANIGNRANSLKEKRYIPKSQIYNASIIHTLFNFKYNKIRFNLGNEQMEDEYTIVTICNGRYYGGGYNIAPSALLDDNMFDIYFVDKISKFSIIKLVPKLKKGTHEGHPAIHKSQTKNIIIEADEKIVANLDGEIIVGSKFTVELIPNALTIHNDKVLVKSILGS